MYTDDETSVLVIGPTRSGKTSSLVVPNVLSWRGAAVVTSTKSELVDLTAGWRQSVGPVFVYDPTGELSDRCASLQWSPLAGCEQLDKAWRVATWLCSALQQSNSRSDNDWAHWTESGKLLVAPLLHAGAISGRSMTDVCAWIHAFDLATPISILEEAIDSSPTPETAEPMRALAMLAAIDQRPERERGTVFSTVMRIFSAFNESSVAASAAWNRFDPHDFLLRRGTLYLCTPRQSPERIASLFAGLLMSVITAAYERADADKTGALDPPLGLFLDELANIVPIEDLPALASQGAGRGVILMSIVQDLSQLRARYGIDRANSVLNNHVCKCVLPGIGDPETSEILSRLIGQGEYVDVQVSRDALSRTTRAYSRRREPLASPDALRQLPDGTAIVLNRGRAPTLVRLRPWFEDSAFRHMSERPYLRNAEHVAA